MNTNIKKRIHKSKPPFKNVELSKQLLFEFRKLLHHYFPHLEERLNDTIQDYRRKASCHYTMSEVILGAVSMYLFRQGSRNQMNTKREHKEFRSNYTKVFGLRLPHMDTVNAVLKQISSSDLEALLVGLVKILFKKRVFHKFRLLSKYFTIAIDGTGVFRFDQEPYEGCPYKRSKSGKITYHQPVVEAKLVCSNGFAISLCSEWIINQDGDNKQDCEYKATKRLLSKLHGHFPRLPICLLMDGLFLKQPIQQSIKSYGWEFIMVWKDKTCWDLQDQVAQYRHRNDTCKIDYTTKVQKKTREEYSLEYLPIPLDHKGIEVYYIKADKIVKSVDTEIEDKKTKFVFMSCIPITHTNAKEILESGRMRWKIENEGFNEQKNNGYGLHHKMNRKNINAIKNYYICIQIAHLLNQLYTLAKNLATRSYTTVKDLWLVFCELLRMMTDYRPKKLNRKYNLRY